MSNMEPWVLRLSPTSTGPRLLDDVFDQPVDTLIQCQSPKE